MIAAHVTVFQCDECQKLISIKSDFEWEAFAKTWHVGFFHDFCPVCRFKISTQARILHDEQIAVKVSQTNTVEVRNAEYVN